MNDREPTMIEFKRGDATIREYRQDGQLHRENGPARTVTWPDGTETQEWWSRGFMHRIRETWEMGR